MKSKEIVNTIILLCLLFSYPSSVNSTDIKKKKSLVNFFMPLKQCSKLISKETWGDSCVLPRDTALGLEDAKMKKWCYWDGKILKDNKGKYHIYASRWSQSLPHSKGWNIDSKGIHAESNNLYGPYIDKGLLYPQWNNGKGTNIVGLKMKDGRYAVISSEITKGEIFVSNTPDGPFKLLGEIKIDNNGFYPGWNRYNELDDGAVKANTVGYMANVMIFLRPDGRYMLLARHCVPMISDNSILGPYKVMADRAWWGVKGIPQCKMEDPTIWYSDGLYHIVVNYHGTDTAYHLTSEDGISNWKNRGIAFSRGLNLFKHQDGSVENWYTVQRPTVYLENGKVKAFNLSVIDVHKGKDLGNDNHGSKLMIVPFDGESFSKYIKKIIKEENKEIFTTSLPDKWKSTNIGKESKGAKVGYDEIVNTICVNTIGKKFNSTNDSFNYIYRKTNGDFLLKGMVLSTDISPVSVDAGYMIRQNLESNSPFIFASFSKDKKFKITIRNKKGEKPEVKYIDNIEAPCWIMFEKHSNNISCYTSTSNKMNWKLAGVFNFKLNNDFFVGMASTSNNEKNIAKARFKEIDLHTWGEPIHEGIIRHTFPNIIPSSGKINFEVEMESVQTLDAWIELENIKTGEKLPMLRKRFWNNGVQKLTYDAGKELKSGDEYWFVIKAVPMHFHDCERIQAEFKKIVVK